jgi:hypothetical protein
MCLLGAAAPATPCTLGASPAGQVRLGLTIRCFASNARGSLVLQDGMEGGYVPSECRPAIRRH